MAISKDVLIVGSLNKENSNEIKVSNVDKNFPTFSFESKYYKEFLN